MAGQFSLDEAKVSRWPVSIPVDAISGRAGIALNRPVCVVGAPGRAHLPLKSKQISKTHALIVQEADGVYVRDLCSTNKTFVNAEPVREVCLKDRDILRFGTLAYRCHSGFTRFAKANTTAPAELHLTSGKSDSRKVKTIDQNTFLIGSRSGCDLVIRGTEIAKAHAIIFSQNGRRHLLDLSGGTGVLINGAPVREAELQSGDDIRIGEFRIEYVLQEESVSTEAPGAEEQFAPIVVAAPVQQLFPEEAFAPDEPVVVPESVIEEHSALAEAPGSRESILEKETLVPEDFEVLPQPPAIEEQPVFLPEQAPIPDDLAVLPEPLVIEEQAAVAEAPVSDESFLTEETPVPDDLEVLPETPIVEEQPVLAEASASDESFLQEEIPVPDDLEVLAKAPVAADPQIPATIERAAVQPPPEQQERAYLRGEPLLLKSAIAFPVFAEKSEKMEDQLELRIEGDILTGALRRPAPKLFPRANKRPPAVTNDEELLSQSFIIRK